MKKFTFFLLLAIIIAGRLAAQTGFTSVTQLTPVPITTSTKDKPQSKVWTYAGKWWCVLATSQGTRIFRLDGTAWTPILTLANTSSSKPDCRVVGDLVHVLVYRGSSNNSIIYSVQYDPASGTYKLWGQRPTGVSLQFPAGSATGTLAVDGTGRMWVAGDGTSSMMVWYSDAPYKVWSGPITIATGVSDDDICAIAKLPGKIGVFWSNQVTKRFGFKTHDDGTDPNTWSADEVPASQSANDNVGGGMADDHMNLKVASDGTLYSAVKTDYSNTAYPRIALLVRRPNGTWDNPYTVTTHPEGEKPVVLLNEAQNKVKVVYTSLDGGGGIVYRESAISSISFGSARTLISGAGKEFDHTTSTHQNYNPDVVILATDQTTTSLLAVGVLATDNTATDNIAPTVQSINRQDPATEATNATSVKFRITFSEKVNGVDPIDFLVTASTGLSGTPATVTTVGTDGTTYDITVNSISGNGTLRLDLKASGTGITDVASNAISGGFSSGQSYTINQRVPTLTFVNIISSNTTSTLAKVGDVLTLRFTSSEPITDPSVYIATHHVGVVAEGGNNYSSQHTLTSSDVAGLIPFSIDFSNTVGTPGVRVTSTTDGSSVTFDKSAPSVTSINRQSPTTESTNSTSVIFRVAFSEVVTGVDAADFNLTKTNTANGTVSSVTSNGTNYDVTVSAISGSGTLRLDLNGSGTGITDAAGNPVSGGFTTGQSYSISVSPPPVVYGFTSVTQLTPFPIGVDTKTKPQAKTWTHDGKWWCVAAPSSGGTYIYRLDGISWTPVLRVLTSGSRADCWVQGNLVHIILFKGASRASFVATLEYDAVNNTYKYWNRKTVNTSLMMPAGSETATLTVDGTGRMWIASDGVSEILAWYSDAPYTDWSGPITIATGMKDDDICSVAKLNGKIGVLWSNQNTGLFGFKTHTDGAIPTAWSADELPASQSAISGLPRMADDHMSIVVTSDGTLYSAIKTSYNDPGYIQLGLMVRRPNGVWDDLYPVIVDDGSREGTQSILVVNETMNKMKVVFTTATNGGDIAYRESSLDNISFGPTRTLITGNGSNYNFATSTHQTYNPEVVILATNQATAPQQLVSVLASDAPESLQSIVSSDRAGMAAMQSDALAQNTTTSSLQLYPNPLSGIATLSFTLSEAGKYNVSLYDTRGMKIKVLKQGWTEAGIQQTVSVDGSALSNGVYIICLQTDKGIKTIKMLKK